MLLKYLTIMLLVGVTAGMPHASEKLSARLEPLRPFLGKTWKGTFTDQTSETPTVDVSIWERALNGQAVRILHSVNDGAYGGETIITWDPEQKSLVFFYFTTAGFFTRGSMTFEKGKFTTREQVTGSESGITEIMGTGEILPDGRLHSTAKYLQNAKWVDGHEVFYKEDPFARVIFR